jgi:hypothetical protein
VSRRALRDLVEREREQRIINLEVNLKRIRAMTTEEYLEFYPVELCPRDLIGAAWADVRQHSPNGEHVSVQFNRCKPGLQCNGNHWEWYATGFDTVDGWLDLPLDARLRELGEEGGE